MTATATATATPAYVAIRAKATDRRPAVVENGKAVVFVATCECGWALTTTFRFTCERMAVAHAVEAHSGAMDACEECGNPLADDARGFYAECCESCNAARMRDAYPFPSF